VPLESTGAAIAIGVGAPGPAETRRLITEMDSGQPTLQDGKSIRRADVNYHNVLVSYGEQRRPQTDR